MLASVIRHARTSASVFAVMFLWSGASIMAAPIRLEEPFSQSRVIRSKSDVQTQGKIFTAKAAGERDEFAMEASAQFDFLGRRLPPAGRDAQALRELREFSVANLSSKVAGYETKVALPSTRSVIVANGAREGVVGYSIQGPLTRETAELLEMPGDPLALIALLPMTDVEVNQEWTPEAWVVQMLTGIEAVESSELVCQITQATDTGAKGTFRGKIKGQRHGTNTTVELAGAFIFDLKNQFLSQAKTSYKISSEVGAVNPGLDVTVTTSLVRSLAEATPTFREETLQAIALEPDPHDLALDFVAAPWGLQLRHGRDWHLFQAVYDGGAPVAILRLIEMGSLIAQCNLSPLPNAAPGQQTPLEQFEADIERSLGDRFQSIDSRERIPMDDGREIFRVVATGNVVLSSAEGRRNLPMHWIYYLVANPQGRQASFVFSVESALLEQLRNRDQEMVQSLDFVTIEK